MTDEEIGRLLVPISDELPSGEDLTEDQSYFLLVSEYDRLIAGPSNAPMVEGELAEGPSETGAAEWRAFRQDALNYLGKSKHLAISVFASIADLTIGGLEGLTSGLLANTRLVQNFWDSIHPLPDIEEGEPPDHDARTGFLSAFTDRNVLVALAGLPLAESNLGPFPFTEVKRIEREGTEAEKTSVRASFDATPREQLEAVAAAIREALERSAELELKYNQLVATTKGQPDESPVGPLNLEALTKQLRQMLNVVNEYGGLGQVEAEAEAQGGGEGQAGGPRKGIQNRQDIIDRLDEICRHYQLHEPTSPVPYLLRRAKRVIHMDFGAIVEEFRLSGDPPIEAVFGSLEGASEVPMQTPVPQENAYEEPEAPSSEEDNEARYA